MGKESLFQLAHAAATVAKDTEMAKASGDEAVITARKYLNKYIFITVPLVIFGAGFVCMLLTIFTVDYWPSAEVGAVLCILPVIVAAIVLIVKAILLRRDPKAVAWFDYARKTRNVK